MSGGAYKLNAMNQLNEVPQDFRFPTNINLPENLRSEVLEAVWSDLLTGLSDIDALAETAVFIIEDDFELTNKDATAIAEALLAYRRTQLAEAKAAGRLQPSRLTAAFDEINAQNVLALQNFSCCGTCGSSEAAGEMYEKDTRGYIYFHMQDTETLIESAETYLGYGVNWHHLCSKEQYDAMSEAQQDEAYANACQKLADEVLKPIFARHDINFDWNGDVSLRMRISNADYFVDV